MGAEARRRPWQEVKQDELQRFPEVYADDLLLWLTELNQRRRIRMGAGSGTKRLALVRVQGRSQQAPGTRRMPMVIELTRAGKRAWRPRRRGWRSVADRVRYSIGWVWATLPGGVTVA